MHAGRKKAMQGGKQACMQGGRQEGRQAGRHEGRREGRHEGRSNSIPYHRIPHRTVKYRTVKYGTSTSIPGTVTLAISYGTCNLGRADEGASTRTSTVGGRRRGDGSIVNNTRVQYSIVPS